MEAGVLGKYEAVRYRNYVFSGRVSIFQSSLMLLLIFFFYPAATVDVFIFEFLSNVNIGLIERSVHRICGNAICHNLIPFIPYKNNLPVAFLYTLFQL